MSDFKRFQLYLERLRHIYFVGISSFKTYDAIQKLISFDVVGKSEAEQNVAVMNKYKGFFLTVHHSLRISALVEVSKLLDRGDPSIHLEKLISFATSKINNLGVDEFRAHNRNNPLLEEIVKNYEGLTVDDLNKVKALMESIAPIKDKIKEYRDKSLVHEDSSKKEVKIFLEEVSQVIDVIGEILNIFSYKTNNETSTYKLIVEGCENDTKNVFIHLRGLVR